MIYRNTLKWITFLSSYFGIFKNRKVLAKFYTPTIIVVLLIIILTLIFIATIHVYVPKMYNINFSFQCVFRTACFIWTMTERRGDIIMKSRKYFSKSSLVVLLGQFYQNVAQDNLRWWGFKLMKWGGHAFFSNGRYM